MRCDQKGSAPLWASFADPQPQSKHEENITQTLMEGYATGYPMGPPRNCQGHKIQAKERLSQPRAV